MRGWSQGSAPKLGVRVSPILKLVLLAWLVLGPLGLWLRRRRQRQR